MTVRINDEMPPDAGERLQDRVHCAREIAREKSEPVVFDHNGTSLKVRPQSEILDCVDQWKLRRKLGREVNPRYHSIRPYRIDRV